MGTLKGCLYRESIRVLQGHKGLMLREIGPLYPKRVYFSPKYLCRGYFIRSKYILYTV